MKGWLFWLDADKQFKSSILYHVMYDTRDDIDKEVYFIFAHFIYSIHQKDPKQNFTEERYACLATMTIPNSKPEKN